MISPEPFPATHRVLRFTGSPEALLQEISRGELYVHTRNFLCELAAFTCLSDPVFDESGPSVFFPESGLVFSLAAAKGIHGLVIDHGPSPALALELAIRGEARAVCIAAVPHHSDMEHFAATLHRHPHAEIGGAEFDVWRNENTRRPSICPCCVNAAKKRRLNPEKHPLTRIFQHADEEGFRFHCSLEAPDLGFSTWLEPGTLNFHGGLLGVVSRDSRSIFEVDLGFVHTLRMRAKRVDDEAFSVLEIYDSVGNLHFTLSAPDPRLETLWRDFCRSC